MFWLIFKVDDIEESPGFQALTVQSYSKSYQLTKL